MGLWDLITGNNTKNDKTESKTRTAVANYPVVDFTEKIVADVVTTKGLYYNTLKGYKLAGVFAKPIIDVPVSFCGYPGIDTEEEDILNFVSKYNTDFLKILKQSHREGTVWIWPWFDSSTNKVKLKFIQDNWVTETYINPETDDIDSIVISKQINILGLNQTTKTITEKTTYTKTKITTTYSGGLKSSIKRNILGILPINFSNMVDGGEHRGHSDFTNILPDMMDYHRTALSMSIELNDFRTKLVQTISGDIDVWAQAQGFTDLNDFILNSSPEKVAMIFNNEGDKTEILTAKGIIDGYIASNKRSYMKIVQGCRVPELFWGLNQTGNVASIEESKTALINLVKEKRIQATANFRLLINSMIKLYYMARGSFYSEDLPILWNQLDAISEKDRAEIFKNFCAGIAGVFSAGVITVSQAYELWLLNYPTATKQTEEEFTAGLIKTIAMLQKKSSPYEQNLGVDNLDQL